MSRLSRTRMLAMARKEWIQLRRDTRSMVLAFALPLLLLVFFGYAISWDVNDIKIAVFDQDASDASQALLDAFTSSGYFSVVEFVDSYADIEHSIQTGAALGALTIPPGFERGLSHADGVRVQLLLDGTDANTATIAQNYATQIVQRFEINRRGLDPDAVIPLRAEVRTWYNPALESRVMIVPGLIAVIMMIISAMLTALTIAREWERGTMEQLAATPVAEVEVVLGKLLPYVLIGAIDVVTTLVAGKLLFDTPFRGDPLLLAAITLLFLIGALGLGIFISAALKSQVLATQVALIATYLPALLLSGFLYDIANMPRVLQGVTYLVPARFYVTVTRGILLKGVGVSALWDEILFMVVFAALGLGLATRVFRKELA